MRRAYFDRTLGRCCLRAPRCRPSTPPRSRSATRRSGASRGSRRDALAPWTERVARSARRWSPPGREALGAARAARSPRRPARSASPTPELAYEGEPPTAEALEARLDRDLERGCDGARPAPATTSRSRPATATCAPSARRASSGSAVLALLLAEADAPRRAARRRRRSSCSTTCSRSSTRPAARRWSSRSPAGPDAHHGDDPRTRCRPSRRSCSRSRPEREVADGAPRRRGSRASSRRFGAAGWRCRSSLVGLAGRRRADDRRATPGRRGSRATARCTSTPPPPPGPSSSATSRRRSWRSSRAALGDAAPKRCGSPRATCRSRPRPAAAGSARPTRRSRRAEALRRRLELAAANRGRRAPRKLVAERPRWASRRPPSDRPF